MIVSLQTTHLSINPFMWITSAALDSALMSYTVFC